VRSATLASKVLAALKDATSVLLKVTATSAKIKIFIRTDLQQQDDHKEQQPMHHNGSKPLRI